MKKLVIKTVVIVLSIIVGVLAITFGILCSTNPKAIAKGFENLGNYSASKYFYEMQYDKTESIDDLLVLIDNAYGHNDKTSLQSYLGELISHNKFKKFCASKNATILSSDMQTEEYYSAFYATVLFENGKVDSAISFCRSYVDVMGYTKFNPFTELIKSKLIVLSPEQKNQIKTALNDYLISIENDLGTEQKYQQINKTAQISLINNDINKLG